MLGLGVWSCGTEPERGNLDAPAAAPLARSARGKWARLPRRDLDDDTDLETDLEEGVDDVEGGGQRGAPTARGRAQCVRYSLLRKRARCYLQPEMELMA